MEKKLENSSSVVVFLLASVSALCEIMVKQRQQRWNIASYVSALWSIFRLWAFCKPPCHATWEETTMDNTTTLHEIQDSFNNEGFENNDCKMILDEDADNGGENAWRYSRFYIFLCETRYISTKEEIIYVLKKVFPWLILTIILLFFIITFTFLDQVLYSYLIIFLAPSIRSSRKANISCLLQVLSLDIIIFIFLAQIFNDFNDL